MIILPSLEIVPAKFNGNILLSQIPVNGTGDFTVSRALNTATRVNSSGNIEVVNADTPRIDYLTSSGTVGCPALLVEPSAQNFARGVGLLNTPTPATVAGGITVTTGSTDFLAPDGSSGTITKYVGGTASGSNFIEYVSSTSVSASGVHTFSAFVKAGATNPLNFCVLQFTAYTAASGTGTSYFNLASGTALTAGASIQNYGNGWYRIISAPYTIAAGDLAGTIRLVFAEGNNDASWPASGALNLTVYAWGIQLEAGSVATSYIPTTTGSVTRNADVVSVSGAVSGSIGQTEGTIYAEVGYSDNSSIRHLIALSDGSSSNRIRLRIIAPTTLQMERSLAGSNATMAITIPSSGIVKIAIGYSSAANGFIAYVNGSQAGIIAAATATFTNELTRINLGSNSDNAGQLNDRMLAATLCTTRLTNTQLAFLTSPYTSYSSMASALSYTLG